MKRSVEHSTTIKLGYRHEARSLSRVCAPARGIVAGLGRRWINHGEKRTAGAAKIGKKVRPTEVLNFGNPQGGTPFIECSQTVGIDLPLKMLAWEDESGQIWLGYNDPIYLAKRHGVPQCPAAANLKQALAAFAQASVAK